jgi:hypothetical protein
VEKINDKIGGDNIHLVEKKYTTELVDKICTIKLVEKKI